MNRELIQIAIEQQRQFDADTSPEERKQRGHFGTPAAIANYMAEMFSEIPNGLVRILDPGAGVGILSAAVCERVLKDERPCRLSFELWESDPKLERHLKHTMNACQQVLRDAGHEMEYGVRGEDFILSNTQQTLFDSGPTPAFHLVIVNPPYFKLRKESRQAHAMKHIVHGQPNIYAFFMAVSADLLLPGGEMVAITPRSYFSGTYFKRFRKWFFDKLVARHIHVFESRKEAFRDNAVLQENVILLAKKARERIDVVLTSTHGRKFHDVARCEVPYSRVIDDSNGECVLRVTVNRFERTIIDALEALPERFFSSGFQVSTGPVVTFRSTEFLRDNQAEDTAPLFWMHNVRPFVTQFPRTNGKPAHIAVGQTSMRLLVPARRYVLLKRFTSKEEKKRLVAGIMDATDSYSDWVGLENHLNYIYRTGVELNELEALGLAAYFNSTLVDRYFRTISGNTQVNASEIRNMPLPDEKTLSQIGDQVARVEEREGITVERIVGRALYLSEELIEQLCESAK